MQEKCVVNSAGVYQKCVEVQVDENGNEIVMNYNLKSDERLIDAVPPVFKMYTGGVGFVRPRADGLLWVEDATPEEITAWELTHPAPATPSAPTIHQRTAALEAAMLAMMGGGIDV